MRWGNYYLAADARISLREENVVLWENTLNSSPQFPPLGFPDSGGRGQEFLSVLGGGRVLPRTASPGDPLQGGGTEQRHE